jgi:hypothetical protein
MNTSTKRYMYRAIEQGYRVSRLLRLRNSQRGRLSRSAETYLTRELYRASDLGCAAHRLWEISAAGYPVPTFVSMPA